MPLPHPTAQQIAFGNAKQLMAQEYMRVAHGKEPLALFEQHMTTFMQKYNMGNNANLFKVLASGGNKKAWVAAHISMYTSPHASPNTCPSVGIRGAIQPQTLCPTYAAQFPEERWWYCGNATISTALVEDSFSWGSGVLSSGGHTMSYNAYDITQPAATALADEDVIGTYFFGNAPPSTNGVGPDQVMAVLNDFVNGHGGNYAEVLYGNVPGNFENDLVTDINQGWDLAGGLDIIDGQNYATLTGYAGHGDFQHWIPITNYASSGATTYYADPIYMAPDYSGWAVPGPDASTPTSNMIAILERIGYIW